MFKEDKQRDKKYLKNLGKKIKNIRLSKKIPQKEIALRCHFDKSSYNAIEAGKRNTTILTLKKIVDALEIKMQDLFID